MPSTRFVEARSKMWAACGCPTTQSTSPLELPKNRFSNTLPPKMFDAFIIDSSSALAPQWSLGRRTSVLICTAARIRLGYGGHIGSDLLNFVFDHCRPLLIIF